MIENWLLDPELAFLNHGSFGACPRAVLDTQTELRARLERSPVQFMTRTFQPLLDEARAELCAFLGSSTEDLAMVPNATTGVNAVLRSLDLSAGDELIVTNHGYNACSNAIRYVAERVGAEVVVAQVPFPIDSAERAVAAVLACVTSRTRLALLDHVTSATALVLPLGRLIPALAERGVECLIDGAHAAGMLDLNLDELGAAYYTGNAHKWICAPKGAAFLRVRPDLRDSVRPAVISHGANTVREGRSRYHLEFDWCGTVDPTAWLSVPAALRFMAGLYPGGWPELRERNRNLALEARTAICSALGVDAPAPDDMLGSMASVPMPASNEAPRTAFDIDPFQTRLLEEHRIDVPINPWPAPPERLIRISAQAYNRKDQYEALAAALA